MLGRNLKMVSLLLSEGCLEILDFLNEQKSGHFNEFRALYNSRTDRIFSANTISTRLKELVELGAIKKIVSTSQKGRNSVGYKITEKGKNVLEIAYRFENELKNI